MSDDKNIRHRFTVPTADVKVNEWIESQSNLGFSLRVLIKAFIREYGIQDATCLELGMQVKKKGRPPKNAKIRYDGMDDMESSDDLQDDTYVEQTVPVKTQSSPVQAQETIVKPVTHTIQNQTEQKAVTKPVQQVNPDGDGEDTDYAQVNMNDLGL